MRIFLFGTASLLGIVLLLSIPAQAEWTIVISEPSENSTIVINKNLTTEVTGYYSRCVNHCGRCVSRFYYLISPQGKEVEVFNSSYCPGGGKQFTFTDTFPLQVNPQEFVGKGKFKAKLCCGNDCGSDSVNVTIAECVNHTDCPSCHACVDFECKPIDFKLSLNQTSGSVKQGESIILEVRAELLTGTPVEVNFSCADLPTGISCNFSPPSCNFNCTSLLTLKTAPDVKGNYSVRIRAHACRVMREVNFSFYVYEFKNFITLMPGWHMISFPFHNPVLSTDCPSPGETCPQVLILVWNPELKRYDRVYRYGDLKPARGYLVYVCPGIECSIQLNTTQPIGVGDLEVNQPGPNLIGSLPHAVDVREIKGNCEVEEPLWYYEHETKQWVSTWWIVPLRAYWYTNPAQRECRFH